ncbi:MAG: amino acid ABC transporter permease [Cyanobacteria bacterium P01_H01_bin.15]
MSSPFAPPPNQVTPSAWLRKNLFSSPLNTLLTLVCLVALFAIAQAFWRWNTLSADWSILPETLRLLLIGRYPLEETWRLKVVFGLVCLVAGLSWYNPIREELSPRRSFRLRPWLWLALTAGFVVFGWRYFPITTVTLLATSTLFGLGFTLQRFVLSQFAVFIRWRSLLWLLLYLASLWLIIGGFGLPVIRPDRLSGLLLSLLVTISAIALSFPLGVLLALARQSELIILRGLAITYIEIVRGVPLISVLFLAQVMLPLVLPGDVRPDRILRAVLGFTLFDAAYLAENIRGGLQSINQGQWDAARAVGLNLPQTLGLIILPQALRVATPAIAGQFISLFKDTSLLSIVGLAELLGITQAILANPDYRNQVTELYLCAAVIYSLGCFGIAQLSRRLESSSEH